MNQITVLKKIDFEPDPEALFTRLRLQRGSRDALDFEGILKDAVTVAKPKGIYRLAFIEDKGDDFIDYNYFKCQACTTSTSYLKHIKFDQPLKIMVDGKTSQAVMMPFEPEPVDIMKDIPILNSP